VKKQVMGATGLMLCGFLFTHMLGNFLIFKGADAFNAYSHALISNPLIGVAELILTLIFLTHIGMAIKLVRENKLARPIEYHSRKMSGRGANFASSTMPYTGMITLVFLIFHILGLKYGTVYSTNVHGIEMRDIYKTTVEYFQSPLHLAGYLVAIISLGIHVSHGFWSAFQSLGLNHPKYMPKIKILSRIYGLVIILAYCSFPLFCFFQGGY
jgi:succinate dehydrogenase / fumarate reductase cytochrome b subunit